MQFRLKTLVTIGSLFIAASIAQAGGAIKSVSIDDAALKWSDMSTIPGAKLAVLAGNPHKKGFFVVRIKFPANAAVAPHFHDITEYDTVIAGTLHLGSGKKADTAKGMTLTEGTFLTIPAKTVHYAWTKEETILQISGVGPWSVNYINAEQKHT